MTELQCRVYTQATFFAVTAILPIDETATALYIPIIETDTSGDGKHMDTTLAEIQDKSRVRSRMGIDAGEWSRLLKSELDTYGDYFTTKEQARIKAIIKELKALRGNCLD